MLPENVSVSFVKGAQIARSFMRRGQGSALLSSIRGDSGGLGVASYGRDRTEGSSRTPEDDLHGISSYTRRRAESYPDDYVGRKSEPCGCSDCKSKGLTKSQCSCGD